jgi:uncharacterized protein YxjI
MNRLADEVAVSGWTTYQLRRQLLAIGEDFWIQNAQGQNVYKLDGKVLTLTQTFALEDVNGNELARMRAEFFTLRRTMDVERSGQVIATVKKALINILGQSFTVDIAGDGELHAQGDILNHEFEIASANGVVATVSKQWFVSELMYGVAIAPGQDEVLMLCIAIAIDEMSENDRH